MTFFQKKKEKIKNKKKMRKITSLSKKIGINRRAIHNEKSLQ